MDTQNPLPPNPVSPAGVEDINGCATCALGSACIVIPGLDAELYGIWGLLTLPWPF